MGNNDYKLIISDSSGFALYNLDYSLYLNVVSPIPLEVPPSYYQPCYITRTLFDCDSTNIEYVITQGIYKGNFYVYRTDGTLLFQRDSVTGPFNIGGLDGSLIQQPIVNTPMGTKLFLQDNTGRPYDSMYVYSLCDSLPTIIDHLSSDKKFVSVYPNPTSRTVNFQIDVAFQKQEVRLIIYNTLMQEMENLEFHEKYYQLDLSKTNLSDGVYIYSLFIGGKMFQSGKFILDKIY